MDVLTMLAFGESGDFCDCSALEWLEVDLGLLSPFVAAADVGLSILLLFAAEGDMGGGGESTSVSTAKNIFLVTTKRQACND